MFVEMVECQQNLGHPSAFVIDITIAKCSSKRVYKELIINLACIAKLFECIIGTIAIEMNIIVVACFFAVKVNTYSFSCYF